uniref:Reverse transcriptase domain-containing protein n=1 Tax=Neogobius melanostomus TaxID=47308 RepID=A0A8C6S602_9GOBI
MQFGFRANHSTDTATCFFIENVKSKMDRGGVVGAVFLDLKRAFDTISHDVLVSKLSRFNFSPDAVHWIKSYLDHRTQAVRVKNELSCNLVNGIGVPQGSILGPLLFSLYINDLPSVCSDCEIQMYADDTVIYVHGKDKEEVAKKLSKTMEFVSQWLYNSCLHLNLKKTECIFFTKRKSDLPDPELYIAGEKISVVTEYKYLGIILDSQFTFKKQVKKVIRTIKLNLANFRYIRQSLNTDAAKLFFYTMIMPHLSYCVTSWSQGCKTTLKPIDSVYKQALKVLDKKPFRHHHCSILDKYNLLNWENFVKFHDANLVFKILRGLAPPPLSNFINLSRRQTRSATSNNLLVPLRKSAFSQSAFSVRAVLEHCPLSHTQCRYIKVL